MQLLTSLGRNGIIFDTNILSKFAKVGYLDLLVTTFTVPLYVTPGIKYELKRGLNKGVKYLADALLMIESNQFKILTPNDDDRQYMTTLPGKFKLGELESVPLCYRLSMTFITDDRKVINHCQRNKIGCIPLEHLLALFQHTNLLTSVEVVIMLDKYP